MAEYIEREAVLDEYDRQHNGPPGGARKIIAEFPSADVAPVVRGKWIADGDGYHSTYNCSICGWKDWYPFNERHNFCPNCGAKMNEQTHND